MNAITTREPAEQVTVRFARPEDAGGVTRLAQLESARTPQGPLLLAEVAGDLVAALPVDGGSALADPFRPTRGYVGLLEVYRRQVR